MHSRAARMALVRRASNLHKIADKIRESNTVDVSALDEVTEHLRARTPTTEQPSPADQDSLRMIVACFTVLNSSVEHERIRHVHGKIHALWPDIWRWTQFLLSCCIVDGYKSSLHPHTFTCVGGVIFHLTREESIKCSMLDTPDFVQIIGEYWLNEADAASVDISNVLVGALSNLYAPTGALGEESSSADLSPLLRAAGNSHQKVVQAALRHLRKHVSGRQPLDLQSIFFHLQLVMDFSSNVDGTMLELLLRSGAIAQIIQHSSTLYSAPFSALKAQCILLCYAFVQRACTRSSNNLEHVLQAIENDFLHILLEAPHHDQPANMLSEQLLMRSKALGFNILQAVFPPYLIYRPVIRALINHFHRHPPCTRPPPHLAQPWLAFLNLVEARSDMKDEFDGVTRVSCLSCKRKIGPELGRLQRCGGCRGPRYCSVVCQKEQWKDHRISCFHDQKAVLDGIEPLSFYDRLFILGISQDEIRRRAEEINAIASTKFGDNLVGSTILTVDWSATPPGLDLCSVESLRTDDPWSLPPDGYVHTAHSNEILVEIKVKWGAGFTVLSQSFDRKSLRMPEMPR